VRSPLLATTLTAFLACAKAPPSRPADTETAAFLSRFVAASSARRPELAHFYLPSATIVGLLEPTPGAAAAVKVWTVPEFMSWLDTMNREYEYVRFRLARSEVRRYGDLAQANLVLRVEEKRRGRPERSVYSLDQLHLVRVDGKWRISAHAWTMELPDQPLLAPAR
jgi:hypothetical protein